VESYQPHRVTQPLVSDFQYDRAASNVHANIIRQEGLAGDVVFTAFVTLCEVDSTHG
jgi:hypothetical protein